MDNLNAFVLAALCQTPGCDSDLRFYFKEPETGDPPNAATYEATCASCGVVESVVATSGGPNETNRRKPLV